MPSACAARISGAPTAAPPTATSFSEAGARWPVCIRWPHQARSICGSRIRLCGWWRCTAAWNCAASKLDEPVRPSSRSGSVMTVAPCRRGAIRPAMFSSSTAKGKAFRWRSICSGAIASTSPRVTRCSASALRHTPLGVPVVPEVKVILRCAPASPPAPPAGAHASAAHRPRRPATSAVPARRRPAAAPPARCPRPRPATHAASARR